MLATPPPARLTAYRLSLTTSLTMCFQLKEAGSQIDNRQLFPK